VSPVQTDGRRSELIPLAVEREEPRGRTNGSIERRMARRRYVWAPSSTSRATKRQPAVGQWRPVGSAVHLACDTVAPYPRTYRRAQRPLTTAPRAAWRSSVPMLTRGWGAPRSWRTVFA